MRILAIETAVQPGSIALREHSRLVSQVDLPVGLRTTQSLLPAIQAQLANQMWKPSDLGLVAVSQGPGSFTGLRVGITVAKTLAYATGAEVLGIDTLDAIAKQVAPSKAGVEATSLWAVMDAQRQQLFCAKYEHHVSHGWRRTQPPCVVGIATWLENISVGDVVSGPPVEKLRARIPPHATFAEPDNLAPHAATISLIAAEAFQQGRRDDLWGLVPKYFRLSAAEEKRQGEAAAKCLMSNRE